MTRSLLLALAALTLSTAVFAAGPTQGPIQGPVQAPVVAAMPVCCDREISYRHHHPLREPCGPRHEVTLLVKDPCACCYVQVPVCIPCCCKGEPTVCCRKGILGRNVTEYTWCCGYDVRVVIDRHGCVTVHYNV